MTVWWSIEAASSRPAYITQRRNGTLDTSKLTLFHQEFSVQETWSRRRRLKFRHRDGIGRSVSPIKLLFCYPLIATVVTHWVHSMNTSNYTSKVLLSPMITKIANCWHWWPIYPLRTQLNVTPFANSLCFHQVLSYHCQSVEVVWLLSCR